MSGSSRTLGLMALKERNFMYGLTHQLDIFRQPKNGLQEKEKIGKITGKKTIPNWFIL